MGWDSYLADMTVNHVNSGAPVYDPMSGQVIGVRSAFALAKVERLAPNDTEEP